MQSKRVKSLFKTFLVNDNILKRFITVYTFLPIRPPLKGFFFLFFFFCNMITMDLEQDCFWPCSGLSHFEHLLPYIHFHGETKLKRKKLTRSNFRGLASPSKMKGLLTKSVKKEKFPPTKTPLQNLSPSQMTTFN